MTLEDEIKLIKETLEKIGLSKKLQDELRAYHNDLEAKLKANLKTKILEQSQSLQDKTPKT